MSFLPQRFRHTSFYILITLLPFLPREGISQIPFPDFKMSILRLKSCDASNEQQYQKRLDLYHSADPNLVSMFGTIYEQNQKYAQQISENTPYRIPPIVHQIWLGSEVPEKYHEWMKSWANLQGWEYKLWTDQDVKKMTLYNQEVYEKSTNYGEKSDILRLEILKNYGGLYVDVDFECIKPEIMNDLHKAFDFYICFEPMEHDFIKKFNIFKVCNAIIASTPNHPLIEDLITNLKANYLAYRPICGAIHTTGPSYLSRIICEYELSEIDHHRNMYLPSTFFYPYTEAEFKSIPSAFTDFYPETAGVHYWSGSWWESRNYSLSQN